MQSTTNDAPDATTPPRPPRRRALVVAGVVVALWLAAVATAAIGARGDLLNAESSITQAQDALADGDVDSARDLLSVSSARLTRARSKLFRFDVTIAASFPWVSNDLRIAREVTAAADDLVAIGAEALGQAAHLAGSDLADGALPVGAIEELAPTMRRAADAAEAAIVRIQASPRVGHLEETGLARRRILDRLVPIEQDLQVAADLVEALPGFLGADGPRRYFLGAANPAELRGVSGYLGSYSILTIEDGDLDFGTFSPLFELPDLRPGEVPAELLAPRYQRFGATQQWKNANMTPDMPSAARTLTAMWETRTGERLDGVMIVDPFALATMLEVTGPVRTPSGATLTADNAVDYLTNEAYADFDDSIERKETLGEDAKAILQEFLDNASSVRNRIDELVQLVSERQILLHATDPDVQAAFAAAGIDGALPDPQGDLVAVVANSASNAKVDYYLERELDYRVTLLDDFRADGQLTLTLRNDAPRNAEPSYVLGPTVEGLEVGDNRLYLSTFCATSCRMTGAEGGLSGRSVLEEELGHPVAGSWVELGPKASTAFAYSWRTDGAWDWAGEDLVYRLTVRTQTAVRPPKVDVTVGVPAGFTWTAEGSTGGIQHGDAEATWSGRPRGDLSLVFRFRPTRDGG